VDKTGETVWVGWPSCTYLVLILYLGQQALRLPFSCPDNLERCAAWVARKV